MFEVDMTSLNGFEKMNLGGILSTDAILADLDGEVAEMFEADAMFCLDAPEFLPTGSMVQGLAGCIDGSFINTCQR